MEQIIDTLPKAKKWATILLVILIVTGIMQLLAFFRNFDGSSVIGLVSQGFLIYFLICYQNACKMGIDDESEAALEEACRQQKNIFLMYGLQAILAIIAFLLIALAILIPLLMSA